MNDVADLIRRATVGDREALEKLLDQAKRAEADGEIQEAARLFREAAICFRISASRERTHKEAAEAAAKGAAERLALLSEMMERTAVVPSLRARASDVDRNAIWECVVGPLIHVSPTRQVIGLLEELLQEEGVEFSAPGGTIQRKLTGLLWTLYCGASPPPEEFWQQSPLVRLAVEYVCLELETRLGFSRNKV